MSNPYKGIRDPRFNELLERALKQALCEFENAPVLAAICDAGVPLWFMMSLASAMRLDRGLRFYCDPRSRAVIVRFDAIDDSTKSLARPILKQIGFKAAYRSGINLDTLRGLLSLSAFGTVWVAPDWVEPGPPPEPEHDWYAWYAKYFVGRSLPAKDATIPVPETIPVSEIPETVTAATVTE